MPWDWETFPEFLDSLDRTPKGVNITPFVGLAPLMMYVMGLENAKNRPSTADEMTEMKRILREAMDAGACGFSAQVAGETSVQRDYDGTPMITDTMAKEDLYAFGSVLSECGRGFMQMTGPGFKTAENLAKASGRPVIFNAVTPEVDQHGQPTQNAGRVMKWLREVNEEKGLRIFGQAITTTARENNTNHFSLDIWNLFDASPPWRAVTLGSVEDRIAAMQDPVKRQGCKDQFDNPNKTALLGQILNDPKRKEAQKKGAGQFRNELEQQIDGGLGLSLRKLVYETGKHEEFIGKTVEEIAKMRGAHMVDTFLDLSIENKLTNMWQVTAKPTNIDALKVIANHPYVVPGVSDGGAHTKFITAGSWSTEFLQELVREEDAMSLEDAHWRLSQYPAQASGMEDRGSIAVGMPADIIVYDFKNLRVLPEEVAYDFPGGEWRRTRRAEGYNYTIVNGVITFEGNRCTGATPGRLLRHGRAS